MIEKGGLPIFSYKSQNIKNEQTTKKVKKISNDISNNISTKTKKSRFVSSDMSKVNIADVLSFIKQEEKQDDLLMEFQNLDIIN